MRNNIYADYSERFIKNVILYGNTINSKLYFDVDATLEVDRNDAKNIFKKGMLVMIGEILCNVGTMKDIPLQEKTEFNIYNGSDWVIYTSYNLVVKPVMPDYDDATGVITIPDLVTTSYYDGETKLEAGAQTPLDYDESINITAVPNDNYSFAIGSVFNWTFIRPSLEAIPLKPTLDETNGVITIPDVVGVVYKDGESIIPSGPMEPLVKNTPKTIKAVADTGYHLKEGVAFQWVFEWTLVLVVPTEPSFNEDTGVITIPDITGVIYRDGETPISTGPMQPLLPDTPKIINVVPDDGFKFANEAVTSWIFEWAFIEVTPVKPDFDESTGTITIPDEEGMFYTDSDTQRLQAGVQAPIAKNTPYIVNVIPEPKYKFPQGATTQWQFEWNE